MNNTRKNDEYRQFAAASLDSARRSRDDADKVRRLAMAEAWLELAERMDHVAKRELRWFADHPLVKRMLRHSPTQWG
jgi:hypothetical protein